ncbi:hypothetical protein ES692_04420 [Psychroserpens burtonensis]|uniref:Uncharacterized protein n=1 Tax=Psychroserpens burtonensis TaxID=49278 RepID=A0A5C7BEA0_9FLAO|nr:hypothetical protein [Psychroserpens burtonensis]TXE19107.1 hypothetical protein ES692_04420 [Psychroserpens burtonensis]
MSENLPNTNKNEEVDLGVLFNAIGKFFDKIFNFISNFFKVLFSVFIYTLKPLIANFKIILVIMILSGVIGYTMEKYKTQTYKSVMYVKPYFDSKYQLVNNINYFNALISNKDYETLIEVFDITDEESKIIDRFEIEIGPESENDKIKDYDTYLKSLDSIRAQSISYDDFIENRDIFSSDFFEITVYANKKDVFKNLENGLNSSFENTYSEKKKQKRDSLLYIKKQNILASIRSVDSLQKVYIKVLEQDSKTSSSTISLSEGFSIEPENSRTKEYELLNKELELRKELSALEEKKIEENDFFDIVSGFQDIGSISKTIFQKYSIILPLLAFAIICLIFMMKKSVAFVKRYD